MQIDFREISGAGLDVTSPETITWGETEETDPLRDIYAFPEPFQVTAHLEKAQENVFLTGKFAGVAKAHCVRCLKTFDIPLAQEFRLTLMPHTSEEGTGGERELEADDLDLAYYEEEKVDLGAVVSEQVALLLDLYPRCRPDCKGLCPVCGADKNDSQCACEDNREDSRWATLKKFKAP